MAINHYNLIRGWAKAIFAIGSQHNCLKAYFILLEHFSEIVNLNIMQDFIKNNWVDLASKTQNLIEITQDVIKYYNLNLDELSFTKFTHIIQLLNYQKILLLLPKISLVYEKFYFSATNSLKITIITARSVDSDLRSLLYQSLLQYFNKDLWLSYEIDPSVLAGLIIKYQDQVIDYSCKSKLLQLRRNLNYHHNGEYSVKC